MEYRVNLIIVAVGACTEHQGPLQPEFRKGWGLGTFASMPSWEHDMDYTGPLAVRVIKSVENCSYPDPSAISLYELKMHSLEQMQERISHLLCVVCLFR